MSTVAKTLLGELIRELTPVARQYITLGIKEKMSSRSYEIEQRRMTEQLEVVRGVTPAPAPEPVSVEERFRKAMEETSPMKVVGRATWADYHSRAASFPPSPTPEQEQRMKEYIISSVASLPCDECAQGGLAFIEANPIDTSSRAALKEWVCDFHNAVNAHLGKRVVDCRTI